MERKSGQSVSSPTQPSSIPEPAAAETAETQTSGQGSSLPNLQPGVQAALEDLLAVRQLSEINPLRVQQWQQAAQVLLGRSATAGVPGISDEHIHPGTRVAELSEQTTLPRKG